MKKSNNYIYLVLVALFYFSISALSILANETGSGTISQSSVLTIETSFTGQVCPDTLTPLSTMEICTGLYQECDEGNFEPLAGRTLIMSVGYDDCGLNNGESFNLTAVTNDSGLACFTIERVDTIYAYGSLNIRVKFDGERTPTDNEPPNSACNINERVNLSAANDCFFVAITYQCDSSLLDYDIIGGEQA